MLLGQWRDILKEYNESWQTYLANSVIGEYEEAKVLKSFLAQFEAKADTYALSDDEVYALVVLVAGKGEFWYLQKLRKQFNHDECFWVIMDALHERKLLCKNVFIMLTKMNIDETYNLSSCLFQLNQLQLPLNDKIFAISGTLCCLNIEANDIVLCLKTLHKFDLLNDEMLHQLLNQNENIKKIASELRFSYDHDLLQKNQVEMLIKGEVKSLTNKFHFLHQNQEATSSQSTTDVKISWRKSW